MPRKTTAPPALPEPDRIWLELERPRDDAHAQLICEKANRMLTRLGVRDEFFWQAKRALYCFGGATGYVELPDRGHWLSLDHLGRRQPIAAASAAAVGERLQLRLSKRQEQQA